MKFSLAAFKDKDSIKLLGRVLAYFKPYTWKIALSFIALAVVSASTAGTAWLIKPALDEIFINQSRTALLVIPILYFAISVAKGLARYAQSMLMQTTQIAVLRTLRVELFNKIVRLPTSYFEEAKVGTLMAHIFNDTNLMQQAMPTVLAITRQVFTIVGLIIVVFLQNSRLAFFALLALPICFLPMYIISRKIRKYGRKNAQINAGISSLLQERFSGIRVIKAFATEESESKNFDSESGQMLKMSIKQVAIAEISSPLMEAIGALGVGVIIWLGGTEVLAGTMTTGAFFSFVAAILMIYDPMKSLGRGSIDLQNAIVGAERVFSVLDSPTWKIEESGTVKFDGDFKELEFDHISFSYDKSSRPVLDDLTLTVKKGERIALVGASGAGKSSFVNLIPRFYDVNSGQIRLNSIKLQDYDLASLRKHIAIVSQENFLFDKSVFENIAYSDPVSSLERVNEAAKNAYAYDFIQELEHGFDTIIGERGVMLSGGQKQRISIARALYKNAPILILDEATSALDSATEALVQKALDNLLLGRTSFVIAHRLSTILNSDRIIVLNEGKISDIGTHQELLERSKLYAGLYALQFKG